MSFWGGILKIVAYNSHCYYESDINTSVVSAKIYHCLTGDVQLIRVNINTNKGEERNYHFTIISNDLYDPEGNIFRLINCTVKIYNHKDGYGSFQLLTSLPGVITDENYNYEVNKGNVHFIDIGDDIIFQIPNM